MASSWNIVCDILLGIIRFVSYSVKYPFVNVWKVEHTIRNVFSFIWWANIPLVNSDLEFSFNMQINTNMMIIINFKFLQ